MVLVCGIVLCSLIVLVDGASTLKTCQTEILVSTFAAIGLCLVVTAALFVICSFAKRKRRRDHENQAQSHKMNDVEGRRNKVFEEDIGNKDDDVFTGGRKRQDSGFVASSNESIIPLPEPFSTAGPRRSPSMPNLRYGSDQQQQNLNEEVFRINVGTGQVNLATKKPSTASVGVSTQELEESISKSQQNATKTLPATTNSNKIESVVIEKKSFNCTGIDFGIGGVYVKDFDPKEISFKKGVLSVGDEVLSINDYPLNGLTDMEAFSFFAKSGPVVKLKISKGVYFDKAEGMSVCSADFQMSDVSDDEHANLPFPTTSHSTLLHDTATSSSTSIHRLPRVIADANNLSMDGGDSDHIKNIQLSQKHADALLLKTLNSSHANHQSGSSSPPSRASDIDHDALITANKPAPHMGGAPATCHHPQNGSNTNQELQELAKLHLAYPGLFMEFLASLHRKEKNYRNLSNGGSDTSDSYLHSRNVSSERNHRQHSRHCSNENCCHATYICHEHGNHHHRNCSCEGASRQRSGSNLAADDKVHSTSPVKGPSALYRSQSGGESNPPIFTVETYARKPVSHVLATTPPVCTDTSKQQPQKQENQQQQKQLDSYSLQHSQQQSIPPQQIKTEITDSQQILHYQQLTQQQQNQLLQQQKLQQQLQLTQQQQVPQPIQQPLQHQVQLQQSQKQPQQSQSHQITQQQSQGQMQQHHHPQKTNSNEFVSSNAPTTQQQQQQQHENVVVQRGYNTDYIVPVNTANFPSVTTVYAKTMHRNMDSSPVRRTSPVYSGQSIPRIAAANITNPVSTTVSPVDFRSSTTSLSSSSPQSSFCTTSLPRKPPPNYASIQKTSSDTSGDGSCGREVLEMDAEVMRKMTQKYCEPRFRRHPPTYNKAISTMTRSETNLSSLGSEGVVLRSKSRDQGNGANRSRPHSYTESGALQCDLHIIQPKINKSLDESEKRKHPKRTHSMPAVKHLEMRPFAAQTFLADNVQHSDEPQPPQTATQGYQQQQATTTKDPPTYDQFSQQQPTATATPTNTQAVYKKTTPKKLKTRQQRAQDSFNRRKSIDSGTLRKLAEEMYENPALGGEFPILSQLLGETQFTASERRAQALYRHKSTEALYSQF